MSKVVDLDAFLAEDEDKAPEFVWKGKHYKCPAEIPYVAYMKGRALFGGKGEGDIDEEDIGKFLSLILGEEAWEQLQADGIGLKVASRMANEIGEYLHSTIPDQDEESGEAPKAEEEKSGSVSQMPTANGNGHSSKPTTDASSESAEQNSAGSE